MLVQSRQIDIIEYKGQRVVTLAAMTKYIADQKELLLDPSDITASILSKTRITSICLPTKFVARR